MQVFYTESPYNLLFELLKKAWEQRRKVFVRFFDEAAMQECSKMIWNARYLLPHGIAGDEIMNGFDTEQPVLFSMTDENRNNADLCLCYVMKEEGLVLNKDFLSTFSKNIFIAEQELMSSEYFQANLPKTDLTIYKKANGKWCLVE